jgi:hypothetical protein
VSANSVESSNIVGYDTQTIVDGKINMKGIAFENITGTEINLNEISGTGMTAGEDETCSDQVLVWNAIDSGYTTYAYFDEGEDGKNLYDVFGDSEPVLEPGKAFWYQSYATGVSGKSIVISGAIAPENYTHIDLVNGKINMVVSPYPVDIDLNDPTTVEFINCVAGEDETCADQVLVWSAKDSGYSTYAYFDEGEDGKNWYDVFGDTEPIIPSGIGFWYSSFKTDGNVAKQISFPRPY